MEVTIVEIILFISSVLLVPFICSLATFIKDASTKSVTLLKLNIKSLLPVVPLVMGIGMYFLLKYLNTYYFLQEQYMVIIASILFTIIFYSLYLIIIHLNDMKPHLAMYIVSNLLELALTGGLIAIFSIITKTYNNSFLIFYAVLFGIDIAFIVFNSLLYGTDVDMHAITFMILNIILGAGLMIAYGVLIITVFPSMWALCFIPFGLLALLGLSAIIGSF